MTSPGRRIIVLARLLLVLVACLAAFAPSAHADLMIIGNDEKVVFDAEAIGSSSRRGRTRSPSWTSPTARRRRSS